MPRALKNSYLNSIYIWVLVSLIGLVTKNIYFLGASIVYTGALPFINIVIWLSISDAGEKIREKLKVFHWAAMFSVFIFLYKTYAQSWAANILNSIFHVDASNFGITYSFVSFFFAPVGLLYHESLLGAVHTIFLVSSMFLVYIIPIALLTSMPIKTVLKITGVFFGSVFLLSFFLSMVFNLSTKIDEIAREIALSTDFNKNHLCQNNWTKAAESVVFLGGDNVLVYSPSKPQGMRFSKEVCDFKKSF
ncbi:MAG: hypothetical protein ACQEUG_02725 [Pseudomonadota bacterium]